MFVRERCTEKDQITFDLKHVIYSCIFLLNKCIKKIYLLGLLLLWVFCIFDNIGSVVYWVFCNFGSFVYWVFCNFGSIVYWVLCSKLCFGSFVTLGPLYIGSFVTLGLLFLGPLFPLPKMKFFYRKKNMLNIL